MPVQAEQATPRPRIFYGWYIVGLTCAAAAFAGGTSQAFLGLFVTSIEDEMGWSRTVVAGAVTVGTFSSGALSAFVGRLADKSGPRALMTFGTLMFGGAMIAMAGVSQVWHFYVAYLIARTASMHLTAGVVPRTALVNWFRRMRGRVVGMQTTAVPLGGAMLAAFAGLMLGAGLNWRTIFAILGLTAIVLLTLPIALVMRRRPEDLGLLPDGDPAPPAEMPRGGATSDGPVRLRGRGATVGEEVSWTFAQAVRTRALWLVSLGMLLSSWASGGISFHIAAYYEDLGLGGGVGAGAVAVFLLSGALSATVWGLLTERYSERLLVVMATMAAVLLTTYGRFITEPVGAFAFAALYGATTRGEGALLMMMLASYFGRGSFGTISGFATQFTFFGLGAGPLVFSRMFDLFGNYVGVFTAATAMLAVAALALMLATRPALPYGAVPQHRDVG